MRKLLCAFLVLGATACGPDGFVFDDLSDVFHDASEVNGPDTYRITESGIQCARAPCPSLRVSRLDSQTGTLVSGIEFPASMPQDKRQQANDRIPTPNGLVAYGSARGEGDARVFVLQSLIER